jgi:hypothetical protein
MSRYTNAVLTVIAGALVALVVQNAIGRAEAQSTPPLTRVMICDAQYPSRCASVGTVTPPSGSAYFPLLTINTVK